MSGAHKINIEEYEKQIGMDSLKLKALESGKYWLALSPKRVDSQRLIDAGTKYLIMYWVNYGDNETYGLFTVEQIKKWLSEPQTKLHTLGGVRERIVN